MNIMNKILWSITAHLPMRTINDGKRPYLERYYLFTLLGWTFYFHRFVGSDPDRGLHDHPWTKAYSIILAGWYWEETRSGTRKVRFFNSLTGDTFHRVVLPHAECNEFQPSAHIQWQDGKACWTLFFHRASKSKAWGFLSSAEQYGFAEGAKVFTPYKYSREGNQDQWWLTAPKRGQA